MRSDLSSYSFDKLSSLWLCLIFINTLTFACFVESSVICLTLTIISFFPRLGDTFMFLVETALDCSKLSHFYLSYGL